jgi:hypothetical protein
MADQYAPKVVFGKFNCNKANKDLGQALGIKVAHDGNQDMGMCTACAW